MTFHLSSLALPRHQPSDELGSGRQPYWPPLVTGKPAGCKDEAAASVRVVTYNILSPKLCVPSYYSSNDPRDLKPDIRLERVLKKLAAEIPESSVICLQEISLSWAGDMHVFFAQHGYHFIFSPYGTHKNGYMGKSFCQATTSL